MGWRRMARHGLGILLWGSMWLTLCLGGPWASAATRGGTTCHIHGETEGYEGVVLKLETPRDFISDTRQTLATTTIDAQGRFSLRFPLIETARVSMEVGPYLCYMYVSPGQSMRISLPPRRVKSKADELNPYFEPIELQLRDLDPDSTSVNARIGVFNIRFDSVINAVSRNLKAARESDELEFSYEDLLKMQRPRYQPFVNDYIKYRAGLMAYITKLWRSQRISDSLFAKAPIRHYNPAYMDLFKLIYDKYFSLHGRTREGRKIYWAISDQRSYTELCKVLSQNGKLPQQELLELVILQNLHGEFFSDNFPRSALQGILDTVYNQTRIPEHSEIANAIREKITRLLPGFIPNSFELRDTKGRLWTLEKFRGRMVLLGFCSTSSYASLEELPLLKRLREDFGQKLAIVLVAVDKDYKALQEFVQKSDYPFTILSFDRQPNVVKDWDIRAYPTYFLLDERGKLILSPAPSPREELGRYIFKEFKQRGWIPQKNQGR